MTDEERANFTALLTDLKRLLARDIDNARACKAAGLPLDVRFPLPGSEEYLEPPSEADIANMEYAVGFLTEHLAKA